jgi:hypothetical protein
MTRRPHEEPTDERLRQLLQVEVRLQAVVQGARENAARRVTAERDRHQRRLAEAADAVARTDAAQARADHMAHLEALAAIDAANLAALAAITGLSDARIDELARRALARAVAPDGDPT